MLTNTAKRTKRRAYPIHGYVGANGSGKSLLAVWDTIPSLLLGRPVLSTVRLLDFERPHECEGCDELGHVRPVFRYLEPPKGMTVADWIRATEEHERREQVGTTIHRAAHPNYIKLSNWQQFLDFSDGDIIMDEVMGVASSRDSHSMPSVVSNNLGQMRRSDVIIRWTAPDWRRADIIIRECSQAVTHSIGYVKKAVPGPTGQDRMWSSRRLHRARTYDCHDFEDFQAASAQKRDAKARAKLKPLLNQWLHGEKSGAWDAYDTFDSVSAIGTVTESGTCYRCSGKRTAPACTCPDYVALQAERRPPSRSTRTRASAEDAPQKVVPLPAPTFEAPAHRAPDSVDA